MSKNFIKLQSKLQRKQKFRKQLLNLKLGIGGETLQSLVI